METVSEMVKEEESHLVNTRDIVEDEETHFLNTLRSALQTTPSFPTECCIYKVPYNLRRRNQEAYTPMLVSIGPFHHGEESLQEMEVHKKRYLIDFFTRRPDLDLEYYFRSLKEFEKRARNCYAENIDLSSHDFITMMLLDGCFIVEFCLKFCYVELRNEDDPIFKSYVMLKGIQRDMVLLQNQLPIFILVHLFNVNVEFESHERVSFLDIALTTMDYIVGRTTEWVHFHETTSQVKHIVDLLLHHFTPTQTQLSSKKELFIFSIPNATRLHESGVKFTKRTGSSVKCFLDAKFTNGNLEIPFISIVDETETVLRNLIAFEQCDIGNTHFFSRYVFLMDFLIDTPNDVELLRKAGIMNNVLGDNEAVSQLFNKVCVGISIGSGDFLDQLIEDVNNYCNRPWHAWKAKLKRDYFNTPWTIISVVAAVILLILAFIQSICSIQQWKG